MKLLSWGSGVYEFDNCETVHPIWFPSQTSKWLTDITHGWAGKIQGKSRTWNKAGETLYQSIFLWLLCRQNQFLKMLVWHKYRKIWYHCKWYSSDLQKRKGWHRKPSSWNAYPDMQHLYEHFREVYCTNVFSIQFLQAYHFPHFIF